MPLYRFHAGEASPHTYYGKGSTTDAVRWGRKLREETGHPYLFQRVCTEDVPEIERTRNVTILEHALRMDAEHAAWRAANPE